jgi:hypothetical protein
MISKNFRSQISDLKLVKRDVRMQGRMADQTFRDFQKVLSQGRSERKPEAYGSRYVEGLSEARTQREGFWKIPNPKGPYPVPCSNTDSPASFPAYSGSRW